LDPKVYLSSKKKFEQQILDRVNNSLKSGELFRYSGNNECSVMERNYAKLVNTKHALGLNSCSSALMLGLKSIINENDKVLMPAFTFVAVPSSIKLANGVPVLVNITKDL